jgi:hypothetical protein
MRTDHVVIGVETHETTTLPAYIAHQSAWPLRSWTMKPVDRTRHAAICISPME